MNIIRQWCSNWLISRRRRKERRLFERGYFWAKHQLYIGSYDVLVLRAFAESYYKHDNYYNRAFDRGVLAACDEFDRVENE